MKGGNKAGLAWSRNEDGQLKRLRERGFAWGDISQAIGRTPDACYKRWWKLQDFAANGVNPYDSVPGPAPKVVVKPLPRPFDEPGANALGCRAHHEALMRFYARRAAA